MKKIPLSDKKNFKLFIGKRILKKDIFNKQGTIPIYSGSVKIPFGYSETSIIDDFNRDYIIWGIDDAVFDFALIPKGTQFTITDHCGAIKILDKDLLPEYVFYYLQLKKRQLGFGWTLRASMKNMKRKASVSVPVKDDGSLDVSEQTRLIEKFREIRKTMETLGFLYDDLKSSELEVDIDTNNMLEVPVSELFDLSVKTNHSNFTKAFVNAHKGDIPVYSASKDENSVSYGFIQDGLEDVKYFENCLTWNIDGSVGKAFFRKGRFSLSEKAIPLVLRPKYEKQVNVDYVRILLEQKALEQGFHYSHKAGKGRIKNVLIPFPINKDGAIDLLRQTELSDKYKKVHSIKSKALEKIHESISEKLIISMD
jgi:restriction endonuclease S subunit